MWGESKNYRRMQNAHDTNCVSVMCIPGATNHWLLDQYNVTIMIKSMYHTKHIAQFLLNIVTLLLILIAVDAMEFGGCSISLIHIDDFHDTATLIAEKLSYHSCQSYIKIEEIQKQKRNGGLRQCERGGRHTTVHYVDQNFTWEKSQAISSSVYLQSSMP